ncbi:glycoside hydrolase superfamily [Pseudomassariella vexata]|uniref:Beta-glucosidase cel3A n=1 Tax=Pseudomassariella vexata TaxID=1141098 RepID=A0A1Y2DBF6_9PEZI|nr:glycoside hydrolase superfamily [Pseudomassariella vexata]ORY56600.1 glycoside hydrolase superfamily [Pseudomassariella vexata]
MFSSSILGVAFLAVLGKTVSAQDDVITSDEFFYGDSPAVYPTPGMDENGTWGDAMSKAKVLVDQMTLEEKVNLTGGVTSETGCSGFIPGVERLGFPGLCLADAGQGVRSTDYVSSWPSGIHVGASWNKELARQRAHFIGSEAKVKGVNVLLGPCVGPVGRVVSGGRNWEGFSVDPYLSGGLVYETVSGIQGAGVMTSTKHFIGQEQETHRIPSSSGDYVEAVSSNIDDKAMHELYLWPFYDAVRAGTGSVMCSLQRLNNSYACGNSKSLNGLLKGELGFQGWVVSDWNAQHGGVSTALAGLDVAMPNSDGFWGEYLVEAVNNGSVTESHLDNMATRILTSWYQLKQDQSGFPKPGYGMPLNLKLPHNVVDARNKSAKSTLFDGAVEGHVLVKNTGSSLPLDSSKMKLISLFGYSAKAPNQNNYEDPAGDASFSAWPMGAESGNLEELNVGFFGNLSHSYASISPNGTLVSGGGSGSTAQNLISAPYDALVAQAHEDGTALFWDFESGNPSVNPTSDACIVIGNTWATEGYDRPSLRDDFTDGLIQTVADQCANTIVVFHNAGARMVDTFIDHPNVTAVIFAHFPGQESGKALISILYGQSNPSGKLPYTVAKNESDYGALLKADMTLATDRYQKFPQSEFDEGVFIDYKHFDSLNITPRYEFGFGLSYTTFGYADLEVVKTDVQTQVYPTGDVVEGGQEDLWDVVAHVTVKVSNTGDRDGKEIAQLYVGIPGDDVPAKQLRGYEKSLIAVGETISVDFPLTRRDLSVWDVAAQIWKLQAGEYQLFVGSSSRDLPLKGTLTL